MYPDRVGWAALGFSHSFNLCEWRLGMEPRLCMFHRGAVNYGTAMYPSQLRVLDPPPLREEESLKMVLVM